MRTAVISRPYEVCLKEASSPEPGPGEILVRTSVSGISPGTEMNLYCGTNPDLVRRRWGPSFVYPMTPGYQSVGVVVQCSPDVVGLTTGDRVFSNGSHAEYVLVKADRAIKLPQSVTDEEASLLSVACVALHGVRRGRIEYGDTVAVVGMGLMGQLAIQHARLAGASTTIAVDTDPDRLEIAKTLGADHVINPQHDDGEKGISEYTEGTRATANLDPEYGSVIDDGGADVVLETAGVASAVPVAIKLGRYGARVVIVGWHLQPISLDLAEDLLYKEMDLLPSRAGGIGDDVEPHVLRWNSRRNKLFVADLLSKNSLLTEKLITHLIPASEIKRAYEIIRTKSEPSFHVILDWRK